MKMLTLQWINVGVLIGLILVSVAEPVLFLISSGILIFPISKWLYIDGAENIDLVQISQNTSARTRQVV